MRNITMSGLFDKLVILVYTSFIKVDSQGEIYVKNSMKKV